MDEQIGGMEPTGRKVAGPAADWVELNSAEGERHVALSFDPRYREHLGSEADLEPILGVLQKPDVPGIAALHSIEGEGGVYVYRTEPAWTLWEIVRALNEEDRGGGIRAGLELCYLAGEILLDGNELLGARGLPLHGNLDPTKLLIQPDGKVSVLGYGLSPVDMLAFHDTQRRPRDEDTFRYAPPERFEELEEDPGADLYVLALLGLELTMGRPVYDGLIDDVRQQASRGDAVRRLYQWREKLPDTVREAYARALKPDPDTRYRHGADFVYAFHDLLGSLDAEGPSLADLLGELKGRLPDLKVEVPAEPVELAPPRRPRPPEPGEEDEAEDPGEQRWARVSRGREEEPEEESDDPRKRLRDRLRSRERSSGRTERGSEEPQSARDRLKARLRARERRGAERLPDPEPEPATPLAKAARDPERRLRRTEREPKRAPTPEPPPEPPRQVPAGSAAAALLERLRAGAAPRTTPQPPQPREPSPEQMAPTPLAPTARTVSPASPPKASPQAQPASDLEPEPVTAVRISAPAEGVPEGDSISLAMEGTSRIVYVVALEGQGLQQVELPAGSTVAACVTRLAEYLGAIQTDLLGRIAGWYVMEQDGKRVAGHQRIESLDPRRPINLRFVENQMIRVQVDVEGVEPPVRFQTPMGAAVPIRFLLAHLQRWLDLPDGPWTAEVGGRTLSEHQVLVEVLPEKGAVDAGELLRIVVRR